MGKSCVRATHSLFRLYIQLHNVHTEQGALAFCSAFDACPQTEAVIFPFFLLTAGRSLKLLDETGAETSEKRSDAVYL